jgi:hypothetical protein
VTEKDAPAVAPDDAPIVEEDWERIDASEAEAGAEEEDIFASREVEIVAEETNLPEADNDDNPYQESDEALPDDKEEAAIRRDLIDPGGGRGVDD